MSIKLVVFVSQIKIKMPLNQYFMEDNNSPVSKPSFESALREIFPCLTPWNSSKYKCFENVGYEIDEDTLVGIMNVTYVSGKTKIIFSGEGSRDLREILVKESDFKFFTKEPR